MSEKKDLQQQSHRPSFGIRMRTLPAILIVSIINIFPLRFIDITRKSKKQKKQQHPFTEFWKNEASNFTNALFRVISIIFTLVTIAWWIMVVCYIYLFFVWLDSGLSPITWTYVKNIFLYWLLTGIYSSVAITLWFMLWFLIAAVAILFGKTIRIPLSIRFVKDHKKDEDN